jgi:O-methyltransferase involved in polyketide biosynthesis
VSAEARPIVKSERPRKTGDLSITALYTNATWTWAKLPGAEMLASRDAKAVFDVTNLALAVPRMLRHGPSLPCSLVQRHVMIDRLVEGATHVLELAAGLSRRGLTMSANPKVVYVEVDRPDVMARKRGLLARTPEGRSVLARPNLRLVGADIAGAGLDDLCPAAAGSPLVVIAEGLFMYLDADAQRSLWRRIRTLFEARPGLLVFDLVPFVEQRRDGLISRALGGLLKLASGGTTFARDERTREDVAGELRGIGFAVETIEPRTAPEQWQLPYRDVRTQQLLFVCRV